ncbi:MAG: DegQ family serine endoprotease [Deltaproteobacteria bacterium]|nr:DegQ family serine endoprotease [Deltaproteobacteria bacterium]
MPPKINSLKWPFCLIATIAIITFFIMPVLGNSSSAAAGCKPGEHIQPGEPIQPAAIVKPGQPVVMVPQNFTQLAKTTGPAVVNIRTVKTLKSQGPVFRHRFNMPGQRGKSPFDNFFGQFFGNMQPRQYKQKSLGSGFIISSDGYIITNNHVVKDADQISVKLKDGDEFDATVIGTDENTDIALIKIKTDVNLPHLALGDSDKLQTGEWVVAIGSPFGLEQTVTAGIVSAKGRVIGEGPYDDFIQTDASINPGNSGGPLLDLEGEVVGINTAIISGGTGIGFAIPSNLAEDIIGQLKKSGHVTRGWLGVSIQDLDHDLKDYYKVDSGVLVTEVFSGDPADKAGIKAKDIITSVNGKPLDSSRGLSRLVASFKPGDEVKIDIVREGDKKTVTAKLALRNDGKLSEGPKPAKGAGDELGIEVTDITKEIAAHLKLEDTRGVVAINVEPGSLADKAGLRKGDIIKEINHQSVPSVRQYKDIIGSSKKGDDLQFYVLRAFQGVKIIRITR